MRKFPGPLFTDEPIKCQATVITAGFGVPGFLRILVFCPILIPGCLLKAAFLQNPVFGGEPVDFFILRIHLLLIQVRIFNVLRLCLPNVSCQKQALYRSLDIQIYNFQYPESKFLSLEKYTLNKQEISTNVQNNILLKICISSLYI